MKYLLQVLLFIYPIANSLVIGENIGLVTLVGGLMIAAAPFLAVRHFLIKREPFKLSKTAVVITVLVLYSIATGFWAYSAELYQSNIQAFIITGLLLLITDMFVTDKEYALPIMQAYIFGCITLVGFIAFNYVSGELYADTADRYSLGSGDPNVKAMQLALALGLLLGHVRLPAVPAIVNVVVMAWLFVGIILTNSRTGFLASIAIFTIFFFYNSDFKNVIRNWLIVLVVAVLLDGLTRFEFWGFTLSDQLETGRQEALITNTNKAADGMSQRLQIWTNGIEALADNPLGGIGFGTFQAYNRDNFGIDLIAHNTHISFLAEGGIIAYLLFLVIMMFVPIHWFALQDTLQRKTYLCLLATLFLFSLTLSLGQLFIFWFFLILLEKTVRPVVKKPTVRRQSQKKSRRSHSA